MVGFVTIIFPLSALKLNLLAVGDVDDLKTCAPEDLLIVNLCITISNLSLDDPLLPYEDLKLRIPSIDVDYFMGLPASEAEKAFYIDKIMDEFGPGFVRVSETHDIVMDSACNLINFYDDVDAIMPMEDVKISPSCSNCEDGFTLNESALCTRRVSISTLVPWWPIPKDLSWLPPSFCSLFGTQTLKSLLSWLLRLDLPERSFARQQELRLVADVNSCSRFLAIS